MRRLLIVAGMVALLTPTPLEAAPTGKAWAGVEQLQAPSVTGFGSLRLDPGENGNPRLVASTRWGPTNFVGWGVLDWKESAWLLRAEPTVAAGWFPEPVLSLDGSQHVVWLTEDRITGGGVLQLAEIKPTGFAEPETVLTTTTQSWEYSAAVSGEKRWAARAQQPGGQSLHIKAAFSAQPDHWTLLPPIAYGSATCFMAPLDSSSAILVHAGTDGVAWVIARDSLWVDSGTIDPRPQLGRHPRLSFGDDGNLWLMYTSYEWVYTYRRVGTDWVPVDSLKCSHAPGETYLPAWCDMARDGGVPPVMAWGDFGFNTTYRDIACVAFPDGSGWPLIEEIPGSEDVYTTAYVVRDRYGDVWAAWNRLRTVGIWYTHTYTNVSPLAVQVSGTEQARTIEWQLSGPAPGSAWAVERADTGGGFTEIALVEAGDTVDLSWTDTEPALGSLQYRIRRGSADLRFEVFSDSASWDHPTVTVVSLANVSLREKAVELEWSGTGAGYLSATVERHGVSSSWQALGLAEPKGPDRLVYTDSSVTPGARYAYRLAYTEDGVDRYTSEAWVDVPRNTFSLSGLSPNPSPGTAVISFSLPASGDAQVEVLDVSGRRLARQRLKGLAAGDHVVDLRRSLPPGLYIIRLQFGDQELVARGVVVR